MNWTEGLYNEQNNGSTGFGKLISPTMNKTINSFTILMLISTMVSLGCTMEISKIKAHFLRPRGVVIALVAQFGIMPLTAFSLAKVFKLKHIEALTVLVCGCCPGGSLSNMFALALKGDMNLSITMTTCSSITALGIMPLLLLLYSKGFNNLGSAVSFTSILFSLILTLVPCGIGITINHHKPHYSPVILKVGLGIWLVCLVVVSVLSGMTLGLTIWIVFSPHLMAVAALMPLTGFIFGYLISSIFKLSPQCCRTISMETGCQNIQLCATILKVAFTPQVIGPLYLFPAIYIVFQGAEALIFIILFRCYQALKPPAEDK
ncbi:hepatic sodium/bile acid cotransporter-like [Lampris incognitus]|uniref:hepatic sodium/bile acid cotransporter-like n=1 Tax=Lampris incognitus TaxID=2546036 RepID=UPI0024B5A184|nr:hepatic sodium/bile acid cotransporter-like [Lampris incognitus]